MDRLLRVLEKNQQFDKLDVPEFNGKGHPDKFVDWLNRVDTVFECKNIQDHRKVRLLIPKLSEYALIWWNTLQSERELVGKRRISTWEKMKDEMLCAFLPQTMNEQTVYIRLRDLVQGFSC